jgi:hypothetical protein
MRLIKLGLLSVIFLFLLITGISLFIPSHLRISKAINIRANRDSIMDQIKDASKWKTWYPGLDSTKPFYVKGEMKGVVFDDKDPVHPVYISITGESENEITAQFISKKMNPVINGWKTISFPNNDSVVLQWYMDFHLRWYPWEKFSSLVLERSYGSKMQQGLTNLKKLMQSSGDATNLDKY